MNEDSIPFPSLDAIEDDVGFCDTHGIGPFDLSYRFVLRTFQYGSKVMEDMHSILADEFGEAPVPQDASPAQVARAIADALDSGEAREFSLAQAMVLLLAHRNDVRSSYVKFDSPDPKVRADGFRQYLIDSGGMRNYSLFTTQGAQGPRYRGKRTGATGVKNAVRQPVATRLVGVRSPVAKPQPPLATPATPTEPVGFSTHAAWIEPLLQSPEFVARRAQAGRTVLQDERVREFLQALDERGGKATRAAIARRLQLNPARMAGVVAMMQRLLNLDGYAVLSVDEESDMLELNTDLLRMQFGVGG